MSSEHMRKKNIKSSALQPTLQSFWGNASNSAPTNRPAGQLAPLPNTVHSSLLQLGMRVRKSVQDGYKTKSTYKLDLNSEKENAPAGVTPDTPSKNKRSMSEDTDELKDLNTEMVDQSVLEQRRIAKAKSKRTTHQAVLRKSDSDIASKTSIIQAEDFGEANFLKFDEDEMQTDI